MSIRAAAVQMEIALHDPERNLARAQDWAQSASDQGANLVVFPELCLTGPIENRTDLIDNSGQRRDQWREIARKVGVDIVAGTVIEGSAQQRHNRCYYINSSGEVVGQYDKRRPWKSEQPHTVAGDSVTVIDSKFGRIGLAICWDLTNAAHFTELAAAGADVFAVPAYWCRQLRGPEVTHSLEAEATHVDALCVSRAFENSAALIFANAAGECVPCDPEFPKRLLGHSQITVPFKGALQHAAHDHEELVIADLDRQVLTDADALYGLRPRY